MPSELKEQPQSELAVFLRPDNGRFVFEQAVIVQFSPTEVVAGATGMKLFKGSDLCIPYRCCLKHTLAGSFLHQSL